MKKVALSHIAAEIDEKRILVTKCTKCSQQITKIFSSIVKVLIFHEKTDFFFVICNRQIFDYNYIKNVIDYITITFWEM